MARNYYEEDAQRIDFLDPEVNSYSHLSYEQQPWFKARRAAAVRNSFSVDHDDEESNRDMDPGSASHSYSLRVKNLPQGLKESGLRNLFSRHGRVIEAKIFRPKGKETWAKVSYMSHLEAQTASQELHGAKPFHLNVVPWRGGRSRPGGNGGNGERDVIGEFKNHPWRDYSERSRQQFQQQQEVGLPGWKDDDDEVAEKLDPHPPPVVEENEEKATESPEKDVKEAKVKGSEKVKRSYYRVILPYSAPSNCSNTSKGECCSHGRFRCSRCKAWYCSQRCQVEDWEYHAPICKVREEQEEDPVSTNGNTNSYSCRPS